MRANSQPTRHFRFTLHTLAKAHTFSQDLAARDPNLLSDWCLLAETHGTHTGEGLEHTLARLEQAGAAMQAPRGSSRTPGKSISPGLSTITTGSGDYARARSELDLARRTLPDSAELFAYTGYIPRRGGSRKNAARDLERAVRTQPLQLSDSTTVGAGPLFPSWPTDLQPARV